MASTTAEPTLEDRFVGCLIAGACGDALGATVEFDTKTSIFRTYGPFGIREIAEGFTDDTQMTLFTAEGLIAAVRSWLRINGGGRPPFQAEDAVPAMHQSYLRWLHTQGTASSHPLFPVVQSEGWLVKLPQLNCRRAPGNTCLQALSSGEVGTRSHRINNSKGCGGVMRAAPCGLLVPACFPSLAPEARAQLAFQLGCSACAITHSHPAGFLSGGCLAAVISLLVTGHSLGDAVDRTLALLEKEPESAETLRALASAVQLAEQWDKEVAAAGTCLSGEARQQKALAHIESLSGNNVRGGGWVGEEALAISVYCALTAGRDMEQGICYAVNHSGDSDSTGAITGNLLGALLGRQSIPHKWLSNVELPDVLQQVALDLMQVGKSLPSQKEWDQRYPPAKPPLRSDQSSVPPLGDEVSPKKAGRPKGVRHLIAKLGF